jgi:hypothetical protein
VVPLLLVMVPVEVRALPLAIVIAAELVRPVLAVRVPPVTEMVPPVLETAPDTAPNPVRDAPLPMVMPELSVSVPPAIWIVPLVMLSSALIVRLPPLPTSSVWLELLIEIAADAVAVLVNSSVDADPVAMLNA